jgi:hypothetical protein
MIPRQRLTVNPFRRIVSTIVLRRAKTTPPEPTGAKSSDRRSKRK